MAAILSRPLCVNSLRPRRNGRYNTDDIFKCIFLKENLWIPTIMSLKFVPKGAINNIAALVQIMTWRRPGDKPLSEPMIVSLLTHICVTRARWVKIAIAPLSWKSRIIFVNCFPHTGVWKGVPLLVEMRLPGTWFNQLCMGNWSDI